MADQNQDPLIKGLLELSESNTPSPTEPVAPPTNLDVLGAETVLGNPQALQDTAASVIGETDTATSRFSEDLRTKDFGYLIENYGSDVAHNRGKFIQEIDKQNAQRLAPRSISDQIQDALATTASGASSGLGAIGTLGISAIDSAYNLAALPQNLVAEHLLKRPDLKVQSTLAPQYAEISDRASQGYRDLSSEGLKSIEDAANKIRSIQSQESEDQYQQDIREGDSTFGAALSKIGRDFLNESSIIMDNPAIAAATVTEGVGSLLPSVGVVGVLSKVSKAGQALTTATGVGITEASGSYVQSANEVLHMTDEQLLNAGPEYAKLKETHGEEKAKQIIADEAGKIAFSLNLPIATALGAIGGKFEANPFKGGTVADLIKTAVSQGVEETAQSTSAELTSNVALKSTGDKDRDLTKGVGTAAAKGLVGGVGSVGATKTPTLTKQVVKTTAKTVAPVAVKAVDTVATKSAEAVKTQLDKKIDEFSPVGSAAVQEAKTQVEENLIQVQDKVTANSTPVQQEQAAVLDQLVNVSPAEAQSLPESLRDVGFPLAEDGTVSTNRVEVLNNLVQAVDKKQLSPEQETDAVLFVGDTVRALQNFVISDDSGIAEIEEAKLGLRTIATNPKFVEAYEKATIVEQIDPTQETIQSVEDTPIPELNEENVQQTIKIAQNNPAGVNPKMVDAILDQKKKFNISDEVEKALAAASRLTKIMMYGSDKREKIEKERVAKVNKQKTQKKPIKVRNKRDQVKKEIHETGKQISLQSGESITLPSLKTFHSNIVNALQNGGISVDAQGNRVEAAPSMERLTQFTNHLVNKVQAINESAAEGAGKAKKFASLTPFGFVPASHDAASSIYVNTKSPNSVATAKEVLVDTYAAIDLHNSLLEIYGDQLPGEPINKPILHESIKGLSIESDTGISVEPETIETVSAPADVSEPIIGIEQEPAQDVDEQQETVSQTQEEETTPETEDVPEAAPEIVRTLLKGKDGKSRFDEAFKVDPKSNAIPSLEDALDIFSDVESVETASTNALPYQIKTDNLTRIRGVLENTVPAIVNRLDDRLQKARMNNKSPKTVIEAIGEGVDIGSFSSMKAVNLLDTDTGSYDKQLIEQASMAGIHWLLNAVKSTTNNDERVAKSFGVNEDQVTDDMRTASNYGFGVAEAKEGLARVITDFWGVQPDENVTMSDTRGIPESIAAEILVVFEDTGLTTVETFSIPLVKDGKTINVPYRSISNTTDPVKNLVDELGVMSSIFGDVIRGPEEDSYKFGSPHQKVAQTQKRNKFTALSEVEQGAIKRAQKIKFKPNMEFLSLMSAIGKEGFLSLLGSQNLEEGSFNDKHIPTVEGKNLTNEMGWNGVMGQLEAAKAYAEKEGIDVADVDTYYNWYITRVGRLHMAGFSPQADKIAREAFTATNAKLDLTKPEHDDLFWFTVAQSSDEVKTEQVSKEKAIQIAKTEVREKYQGSIDVFTRWLEDTSKKLSKADTDILSKEFGNTSTKILHTVLAIAKYDHAQNSGNISEFDHKLSLEADGKTNGPINAIMNFSAGEFTENQLKLLAKGGFYPGHSNKTYNDHYAEDSKDLYELSANRLRQKTMALSKELSVSNPQVQDTLSAILRFSSKFGAIDFDSSTGELKIGRNTMKNPLTVTVYGSGIDGIVSKVSSALITSMYEAMSNAVQNGTNPFEGYEGVSQDIQKLFFTQSYKDKEGKWVYQETGTPRPSYTSYKDFSLSLEHINNFNRNLRSLFVEPMNDSIMEMMGDARATAETFQIATQIQAIVMQDKFAVALDKKLKERRAETGNNDYLSQKEYDDVYRDLEKFGAIVDTGTQAFDIGSTERGRSTTELSRGFNDQYRSTASLPAPTEAGVKAAPYITIGTGDARMMLEYLNDENTPNEALLVFDGIDGAADKLGQISEGINKAVTETWLQNPAQAVSDSFTAFMREDPFGGLTKDTITRLKEAGLPSTKQEALDHQKRLSDVAKSIQARKDTLSQIEFSTHHMVGSEGNYTHEGQKISGDILTEMNKIYDNNIEADPEQVIEKPLRQLEVLVEKHGNTDDVTGAISMDKDTFTSMMDVNPTMKKELEKVYSTVKDKIPEGINVVFGSRDQLTDYRNEYYPDRNDGSVIGEGQIDLLNNVMYISNIANETIVHEVVHAATMTKVYNTISDPSSVSESDHIAITRLDALMKDFLNRDYDVDSSAAREAVEHARSTIQERLALKSDIGNAAAINEFMAWSLTNENLIKIGKSHKVTNPVARLGRKAIHLMKRLLGMSSRDTFSNILFNTKLLLHPKDETNPLDVRLDHTSVTDPRLADLAKRLYSKAVDYLKAKEVDAQIELEEGVLFSLKDGQRFLDAGFSMNMEQKHVFNTMQAVLATEMSFDPLVLNEAQLLYDHVLQQIKPEDFSTNPSGADMHLARSKYDALVNVDQKDPNKLTGALSSFLALGSTNPEFRQLLDKYSVPENTTISTDSFNDLLDTLGDRIMEGVSASIVGDSSVTSRIDALAHRIAEVEADTNQAVDIKVNKGVSALENQGVNLIKVGNDKVYEYLNNLNPKTKVGKLANNTAQLLSNALDENRSKIIVDTGVKLLNNEKVWGPFREVMNEIIGMTDDNESVLSMVNLVKNRVSGLRQDYKETLPRIFADKFVNTDMNTKHWSAMYNALGKTDITALHVSDNMPEVLNLLINQDARKARISDLESNLNKLAPKHIGQYVEKSRQLANYMMTGKAGTNLLRNADAIAMLLNEDVVTPQPTSDVINTIDQLTSLYALDILDPESSALMDDLVRQDNDGVMFLSSYLSSVRQKEVNKLDNTVGRLNRYKGYIPAQSKQDGVQIIIADASNEAALTKTGYVRKGQYEGPIRESKNMYYYYSNVSGNSTYTQGVMQTVHKSVNGIDPITGRSHTGATAGLITGPTVPTINAALKRSKKASDTESLLPIFDDKGEVVAFERAMDPDMLSLVDMDTHIGRAIGSWRGRQAEEHFSQEMNDLLVDRLKGVWDRDKSTRSNEFVNLKDTTDPQLVDTWNVIPKEAKDYIASQFGSDGFMVRRDMLNNALGYRSASIKDVIRDEGPLNNKVARKLTEAATAVFGANAYKSMVMGERGIQSIVSTAKQLIVIKSGIVPISNLMSNQVQMLSRGVNLRDMLSFQKVKIVELNQYVKNTQKRVDIESQIQTETDPRRLRNLRARLKSLKDSEKRMSIAPLIEAGEFSTISEGLVDSDLALANNRWMDWVESQMDRLPTPVATGVKNFLLTKDTSLYKGMTRAVQYGDFLAKATYYEHLIKREGLSKEDALRRVTEEFVNYNFLAGRTRDYTESMGITWFWNFKLRSIKVGLDAIRKNPLRVLIGTGAAPYIPEVPVVDIGSPITDNFIGKVADGNLDYSIGWGMGINAFKELNPWVNMFK